MKYDRITRWLHVGLALTVLVQLFSSLFMQVPSAGHTGTEPGAIFFHIHRSSGIGAAGLIMLHWLWQLTGHVANGWGHLFPWFSANRMRKLKSDLLALPKWMRNGFPDQRHETLPLAGAVHGLGLLAVTGMAATGTTIFFRMGLDGGMPPAVLRIADVHAFIAGFVWIYVIGHAGMAVFHQLTGTPLISDMFNLTRKRDAVRIIK